MFRAIFISLLIIAMTPGTVIFGQSKVVEFDSPKMKVFLPPKTTENGMAVVACPGGGYSHLAQNHEGYFWAPFFNNLGFAYAVVEYSLPKGNKQIPMNDIKEAFKILKDSAENWNIKTDKIGIMGSSAGGHLASTMATHPDEECRPAFQILFYPVISLEEDLTHKGTRKEFLGENPSEKEVREWSNNNNVTASTPPAFIALSSDDKAVNPINSTLYYNALVENSVPAALFIYPEGGHGWGYRSSFKYRDQMLQELTAWLKNLN